jgi:hypothetical protein
MKPVIPIRMKCAVLCALVSLEFISQASAVLRPLFPFRPAPPSNGEFTVIEDEVALRAGKKPLPHPPGHAR